MFTLIHGAEVYTPEYKGKQDIVIAFHKIVCMAPTIRREQIALDGVIDVDVFDGSGCKIVPGFIDQHVHIAGGGGEGGFQNRTPEIMLSTLTTAGITTVVGVLGTDGTTRSVAGLLAKARGLELEGITTFMYSGAYQVPTRTITDNPRSDLILIDKVIGIGEIAIADHRSTHPSDQELIRLASEARVGGMLAGKAGIVHMHVGDDPSGLQALYDILEKTDIPITQFCPTHLNRQPKLLEESVNYGKKGGYTDITSGIFPDAHDHVSVKPSEAIKYLLDHGVDLDRITMSSDSNGSSPIFDEHGKLVGMGICEVSTLWREARDCVIKEGISLQDAVQIISTNVAGVLKLPTKGRIDAGMDADLVMLDDDYQIRHVFAKGTCVVRDYQPEVWGTFEQAIRGKDVKQVKATSK
ncbi:beta-aspartyl-peptidase [Fodinisporobacter ferrooxydans]|uniref:Isoaspartyl dipeptidase n=1 Tax=Fodinisporobacter ferrooxydans TaxID=2901836 RepID=A0ABY4CKM8_9BACL|nr:beta-aspartyl-peptidase [Alicyclobacillaceae bacterium MYW30-H2]